MALCEPWIDADDVDQCAGDASPTQLARAATAAGELLYLATARLFTGLCEDTVRPCNAGRCRCAGPSCGCRNPSSIELPGRPIVDVLEVLVDGEALTDWGTIVDDRYLVRTEPHRWPCCQRLDLPATEAGTWEVTYTHGTAIPEAGKIAAERLACELAKGYATGDCAIPREVVSMTAESTTYAFQQAAAAGLVGEGFGLPEVADFIRATNPHGLRRRGRLLSARDLHCRPRRVRVPVGSGGGADTYDGGDAFGTGDDTYDGGDAFGTGGDIYSGGSA